MVVKRVWRGQGISRSTRKGENHASRWTWPHVVGEESRFADPGEELVGIVPRIIDLEADARRNRKQVSLILNKLS
ncbi:hypothetical protein K440DRAFT_612620 [Wilcoxina mikolae CBS 423.85]|nr:hypothetical protein K440DRAFT_612620 [Wilcoxina mikolae CBS 423.85]